MVKENSSLHIEDSSSIELPVYMRAVEEHQDHPVIKNWFYQITPCQLHIPGEAIASFLMLEFRDQRLGAMVWQDANGNWGTGGWRPISIRTGTVSIDVNYLSNAPAANTFVEVLGMVATRRREISADNRRSWWKFWGHN